jgi:hypothetical protein
MDDGGILSILKSRVHDMEARLGTMAGRRLEV